MAMLLKRGLDLAAAGAALAVLLPYMALLALLVKANSPGPALYRAVRIGRGGRPFVMYKFRSMRQGPDASGLRVTSADDPRITGVGRFLRRTKQDELPQLWNIVKGDMSLVGTRPQDPLYFRHYTAEQRQVFRLRPGLVSAGNAAYPDEEDLLAQAGDQSEEYFLNELMPAKLRLDLDYVERPSLRRDLGILLRAIWGIAKTLAAGDRGNPPRRTVSAAYRQPASMGDIQRKPAGK